MEGQATKGLVKLLSYAELPPELRSVTVRHLLVLAREGKFVRPVRVTPHAPPLWPADAVEAFLAEKVAASRGTSQ